MTEHLTISNKPLEHPGMDFALLRQEGIKHIERLGGKLWTDYNTHDPGITILEQLCYAITDLSYRLDFEMKDLLAPNPDLGKSNQQFFTAREILTTNPVTINDYRKLLIDIDGVKNAFLEPITDSYPEFYYNSNRHILTFASSEATQEVNLNGLYRVFIDKEQEYSDAEIIAKVTSKLNQHRNLCEDFAKIEILPVEQVAVKAEIEIEVGFDVNDLMAKIYFGLDAFVSPDIQFYTLKELLEQGKPTEIIFGGCPLQHGFIDDEQLLNFVHKKELRTSDLIKIILDIAGIKDIKNITLSGNRTLNESWVLPLEVNHTARLKDISVAAQDITFYKNQIVCHLNPEKISEKLELLKRSHEQKLATTQPNQDIPIPVGEYRELSEYISIQHDFPNNYGIGELGLPASASEQRKAQAKQLQAYLMFFDQLLGNYFAQLDSVKDLFSLHNQNNNTYFNQELTSIPGFQEIFTQYTEDLLENKAQQQERKNRFLDYLIAQYCEKFTDYSLVLYESILNQNEIDNQEESILERHLDNKISFLQNYPKISAERGQAFDYTDSNIVVNLENVSGLKHKICSLLAIPYTRQTLASSETIEGFHLVEHILLRPKTKKLSENSPDDFLNFSHRISAFSQSTTDSNKVTCTSVQHGLIENEQIRIFSTRNYNGTYHISNPQQDTFDIEKRFIQSEEGQWVEFNQPLDPYSFQLSFVFPNWLPRFQDNSFKQLIYNVINAELPAHITPYYYWLDQDEMREFETAYNHWLNTAINPNTSPEDLQATINNLIEILKIGTVEIIPFNLIGYMTIEDDFVII